jgi:ribosomal protein S12 methylthiotransferase accessory factor
MRLEITENEEEYPMDMEIRFPGGKKVEASFDNYTVKTDQPVSDGGTGSAPSPFDLFLASIGTCTGYYVLSFCQKNNIPTQNITLHASMERNQKTHLVEHCDLTINLPNDFPKKYTNAMIKAAEVCTVKRNLQNPPKIDINVVPR